MVGFVVKPLFEKLVLWFGEVWPIVQKGLKTLIHWRLEPQNQAFRQHDLVDIGNHGSQLAQIWSTVSRDPWLERCKSLVQWFTWTRVQGTGISGSMVYVNHGARDGHFWFTGYRNNGPGDRHLWFIVPVNQGSVQNWRAVVYGNAFSILWYTYRVYRSLAIRCMLDTLALSGKHERWNCFRCCQGGPE